MPIISLSFLVFLPLVLVLYYLFPRRLQNWLLLIASYLFCASWAWEFGAILLGSTLLNFYLAHSIETVKRWDRRAIPTGQRSKVLLWAGIGLNVLALAYFKYSDFFLRDFQMWLAPLGLSSRAAALGFLLPVGLSFYTLGAIAYLVDVEGENMPASQDLVDFGLYMAYFPKLLAGPIERARDFLPRLAHNRVVDNEALARSVTLIVLGLIQKTVIADGLMAFIPADMFRFPRLYTSPELAIYWLAYLVVLYNDLAGYTRLARGVSGLFGIELSRNFAWPFFARNFTELWPRWHSTLSDWLRDYVYFPLTRSLIARAPIRREPWLAAYRPVAWIYDGLEQHLAGAQQFGGRLVAGCWLLEKSLSRLEPARQRVQLILPWRGGYFFIVVAPPVVTMVVSGAWHRFTAHMLAWGLLNGLLLAGERLLFLGRQPQPSQQPLWRRGLGQMVFWTLAAAAAVPFGMDLDVSLVFWQQLVTGFSLSLAQFNWLSLLQPMPLIGLSLGLDWVQYRRKDEFVFLRWPRLVQATLLAGATLAIILATSALPVRPFIYQGF